MLVLLMLLVAKKLSVAYFCERSSVILSLLILQTSILFVIIN